MTEAIAFARRAFAEGAEYIRGDLPMSLLVIGILATLSFSVDTFLPNPAAAAVNVGVSGLTVYLQILLTFRMLYANGAAPPGYTLAAKTEARVPSMIAVGFISGVAILLGLLVLVLPGLILMVFWSLTLPALAAERLGASDAMRRSWHLARPAFGCLALIGAVFVVAVALIFLMAVSVAYFVPHIGWLPTLITDVCFPIVILWSAPVWTAAYLELRNKVADLA